MMYLHQALLSSLLIKKKKPSLINLRFYVYKEQQQKKTTRIDPISSFCFFTSLPHLYKKHHNKQTSSTLTHPIDQLIIMKTKANTRRFIYSRRDIIYFIVSVVYIYISSSIYNQFLFFQELICPEFDQRTKHASQRSFTWYIFSYEM
jgi:hypothetical protein